MFSEILSLDDIKKEPFIIENIRWATGPKDVMEPRQKMTSEGVQVRETIKGYIFYIDVMGIRPSLFLMRHTAADYAETLAQIEEIPEELLQEAIGENKDKMYFGMCQINKQIEEWLKRELGVL